MNKTVQWTNDLIGRAVSVEEPTREEDDVRKLLVDVTELISIIFRADEKRGLEFLSIVWMRSLGLSDGEVGAIFGRSPTWVYDKRRLLFALLEELRGRPGPMEKIEAQRIADNLRHNAWYARNKVQLKEKREALKAAALASVKESIVGGERKL